MDDACEKGDVDQAINLIEHVGQATNDPDEEGFTPLINVVFVNQINGSQAKQTLTSQLKIGMAESLRRE